MKIFNQEQLQKWDSMTIEEYEIDAQTLIQQAANLLQESLEPLLEEGLSSSIHIFCGMGHNGADGLALANLLSEFNEVDVYILNHRNQTSAAFDFFLDLVSDQYITVHHIDSISALAPIPFNSILIDSILGTGVTRPLDGLLAETINFLNKQVCYQKVALDYPTGLHPDKLWSGPAFKADRTFTIASRRLSSFFEENSIYLGVEDTAPLLLSDVFYHTTETRTHTIELLDIAMSFGEQPHVHSYKNSFGHVLFIGGSSGKMGAATLASEAALRAGCGLVTAHIPSGGLNILQITLPEAMVSIDANQHIITELPMLDGYQTICIGCGMSIDVSPILLKHVLASTMPKVFDADALNLLARHPELFALLDETCVLTPHIGEFHRLFGECTDSYQRHKSLIYQAQKLGCYIILKGHHTTLATPDGICHFNTTGSVALATAGSGDILAGYLAGHLAQGMDMTSACRQAICFHGYAGDLLQETHGSRGAIASDILMKLGKMEYYTNRMISDIMEDIPYPETMLEDFVDDFDADDPLGLRDMDDDPFGIDYLNNPN